MRDFMSEDFTTQDLLVYGIICPMAIIIVSAIAEAIW